MSLLQRAWSFIWIFIFMLKFQFSLHRHLHLSSRSLLYIFYVSFSVCLNKSSNEHSRKMSFVFQKLSSSCIVCGRDSVALLERIWRAFFEISKSSHRRCSMIKGSLEISQNSQENTCARVPFLIKLQASSLQLY